jgi:hypothetical protein
MMAGAAAVSLFFSAGAVSAQEEASVPDYSLSDFELGEHVAGEKLKLSQLDGKVTVIEYWGTR